MKGKFILGLVTGFVVTTACLNANAAATTVCNTPYFDFKKSSSSQQWYSDVSYTITNTSNVPHNYHVSISQYLEEKTSCNGNLGFDFVLNPGQTETKTRKMVNSCKFDKDMHYHSHTNGDVREEGKSVSRCSSGNKIRVH